MGQVLTRPASRGSGCLAGVVQIHMSAARCPRRASLPDESSEPGSVGRPKTFRPKPQETKMGGRRLTVHMRRARCWSASTIFGRVKPAGRFVA
jgi:hypothetical protein